MPLYLHGGSWTRGTSFFTKFGPGGVESFHMNSSPVSSFPLFGKTTIVAGLMSAIAQAVSAWGAAATACPPFNALTVPRPGLRMGPPAPRGF